MKNVAFSVQPIAVLSLQVWQRKVSYTIKMSMKYCFGESSEVKSLNNFFWLETKPRNLNQ